MPYPYHCPGCGSENVVLHEWQGAYDGWMAINCHDCNKRFHRNGKEIVSAVQRPRYGPVDFVLSDGNEYVNLFKKNDTDEVRYAREA